jgi:rhamnosyltransferase
MGSSLATATGSSHSSAGDAVIPLPERDNVAAVIVTFHPDARFHERLRRIESQVAKVIVVDNGSSEPALRQLANLQSDSVEVIFNGMNLGIGAALNAGCCRAAELNHPWVITFDQDTQVSETLLSGLAAAYSAHPDRQAVRLIGANYIAEGTGDVAFHASGSEPWVGARTIITSGTLMPTRNLSDLGSFRADFFIDFVDHEYCLRARKLGYRVIATAAPLMQHRLSAPSEVTLGGKRVLVLTNSAAFRRYYIARNSILVAKEYWRTDAAYVLRSLLGTLLFSVFLKIPLEKEQRFRKMRAIAAGCRDGLLGRTGSANYAPGSAPPAFPAAPERRNA